MATFRRDYNRFVINKDAVIITKEGERKKVILQDLSASGAAVTADRPFEKQEKVRINIDVPAFFDKPIDAEARVVWSKKLENNLWQVGLNFGMNKIRFPKLGSSDKAIIRNFINWSFRLKTIFFTSLVTVIIGLIVYALLSVRTLNLEGISFDPSGKSRVLINGRFYYEGDSINYLKIKSIGTESVELLSGNKIESLELNKKFYYFHR